MLNLNTNNDYGMAFSHHHVSSPNDQPFYNLYSNASTSSSIKDKGEFLHKNQSFLFLNNNSTCNEALITKDCENSKRFSVNNLLKTASEPSSVEKLNGKSLVGSN